MLYIASKVAACSLFSLPLVPESHVYLRYSTNRTEVIVLGLGFGASQNQDQLVLAYYSTQVRLTLCDILQC